MGKLENIWQNKFISIGSQSGAGKTIVLYQFIKVFLNINVDVYLVDPYSTSISVNNLKNIKSQIDNKLVVFKNFDTLEKIYGKNTKNSVLFVDNLISPPKIKEMIGHLKDNFKHIIYTKQLSINTIQYQVNADEYQIIVSKDSTNNIHISSLNKEDHIPLYEIGHILMAKFRKEKISNIIDYL